MIRQILLSRLAPTSAVVDIDKGTGEIKVRTFRGGG